MFAAGKAGFLYIVARADGDLVVAESNENNNVSAKEITIGSELIASAFAAPSSAAAGATISVSDTMSPCASA